MFVGEAPGADEDKQGIPFVGKAGQLLRATMEEAGFQSYAITNVVKCRPPGNRKPNFTEIARCNGYLWNEITVTNPATIVALGATACEFFQRFAITDEVKEMSYRELRQARLFGIQAGYTGYEYMVFATYHPSYILRGGLSREDYLKIFKHAYNLIDAIG
jgi:DNA polymerase